MKRKILVVIMTFILFIATPFVIRAEVTASLTGTNSLIVGKEGVITFSLPSGYGFDANISNSKPENVSLSHSDIEGGKLVVFASNTAAIKVKGLKAGESTITLSGVASNHTGVPEKFKTVSIKITVSEPAPVQPKPTPPVKPKPDDGSSFVPPSKDDTDKGQPGNQITEEEKKKNEEEKKQAELEEKKKIPLISKISIFSESERMKDMNLTTIETSNDKFTYSYDIPRGISKIRLELPEAEGLVLDYKKEIELHETVSVKIIATQGEISQTFTLELIQNSSVQIKREFDSVKYNVNDDILAKEAMLSLGFTENNSNENVGLFYTKYAVSIQILEDEKNNAFFFILDENYDLSEITNILISETNEIFYSLNNGEITEKTIYNTKFQYHSSSIFNSTEKLGYLMFDTGFYGWSFEEDYILYGMFSDGVKDTYFINGESVSDNSGQNEETVNTNITKAFVVFDNINKKQTMITMASSIGFAALLLTNFIFIGTKAIKQKKYE